MSDCVFHFDRRLYVPSGHSRGPWDDAAQHGGAPAALLAREIERLQPGSDMFVARTTFEFLGPVPIEPLQADAWIQRPGRRFQIVEAELRHAGRAVVRARAVRLRRTRVELPEQALADGPPACEGPDRSARSPFPAAPGALEGFHRTAMDIRFAGGTDYGLGRALAWFRLTMPLIAGETPTGLQRLVAAADFGNGISRVLDFDRHLFVNTDLTVHVHREPAGEWVLVDARTAADPGGAGLAVSRIYDEHGALGVAAQTLFVDTR
jgi:hypothetical protein